jgi:hypothetical protein
MLSYKSRNHFVESNFNGYIFEYRMNELGPDEYLEINIGHMKNI